MKYLILLLVATGASGAMAQGISQAQADYLAGLVLTDLDAADKYYDSYAPSADIASFCSARSIETARADNAYTVLADVGSALWQSKRRIGAAFHEHKNADRIGDMLYGDYGLDATVPYEGPVPAAAVDMCRQVFEIAEKIQNEDIPNPVRYDSMTDQLDTSELIKSRREGELNDRIKKLCEAGFLKKSHPECSE